MFSVLLSSGVLKAEIGLQSVSDTPGSKIVTFESCKNEVFLQFSINCHVFKKNDTQSAYLHQGPTRSVPPRKPIPD